MRLAEDAALGLRHSNDGERPAFDLDLLAERIAIAEQVGFQVGADNGNRRTMAVFNVGKIAAGGHLGIAERGPVGGAAVQRDIGQRLGSHGDGDRASGAHSEIADEGGMVLQVLELVRAQLRVPLLHLQEFLGIEIAEERDFDDPETVGAHVGDSVGDIYVHAVDHGHHGNQGGGGQDDTEQREKAAQLAGAQRI